MRYEHGKYRIDIPVTAIRKQLMVASMQDAENAMTKKRFVGTFVSLMFGAGLAFSSIFYVPAYIDFTKPLGSSTEDGKFPQIQTDPGILGSYANMFKIRRGYIKAGQALTLTYNVSSRADITTVIGYCSAPSIIEVFYCNDINESHYKITARKEGKQSFTLKKPGFYHFRETVTYPDGAPMTEPYSLYWHRSPAKPLRAPLIEKPVHDDAEEPYVQHKPVLRRNVTLVSSVAFQPRQSDGAYK